jgi:haloalkane dehalogenase
MSSLPFPVRRELFPVEHRFLELDGTRVHYVDEGGGDTILLLHGNLALDFPGYGMSSAPAAYGYTPREHSEALERFVDRLALSDLTIMVQDWGGPIGLGFAARRPELVRRLIIGNTWAWPHDRERRIRAFSWIMGGQVGKALTRRFNFVPRVFFSRGFAKPIDPEVLKLYFAPWQGRGVERPP